MHKTDIKGQNQSYVSVIRPDKKSVLSDSIDESDEEHNSKKLVSQTKNTTIKVSRFTLCSQLILDQRT